MNNYFIQSVKNFFQVKLRETDWVIFTAMTLLMGFALFSMTSSEMFGGVFYRQLTLIIISLLFFLAFSFFDYRALKNSYILMGLYLFLVSFLALIFIFGYVSKGGNRWFNFGSFFIGPSEPMKIVLILVLAKFFSKRHILIGYLKNILISFIYLIVPVALILLQPDLSTALVLCFIWFGLVLISGLTKKHILWFSIIGLTGIFFFWNFLMSPYQKTRIISFLNPTADLQGSGWNAYQSIIAVGSGGLTGKGVGFGTQSRLGFLPEHETDFIFASFLEEWGFVGGIFVFVLFALIIYRLTEKASKGNSNFETLFILGVAIWFIVQSSFNIGMNIGVLPVTGIPLPLMSYGGSHLLAESIALGMCVGMSRYGRVTHPTRFKNEFLGVE